MGIDINLKTNNTKNCLHIAADYGHLNLCRMLIGKHNVDVELPNHKGWTALHYFAKRNSYELLEAVADMGMDINLKTNNTKNCLHIAADYRHLNLCMTLISKHKVDVHLPDHGGWTAFHYFAKCSSYELVVDMGVDINLKTNNGKNCLHIAAHYGHFSLCRTLISNHNIDVELPDHDGWTALHYFAKKGTYELLKTGPDIGINSNLETNNGENCLHIAAGYGHLNLSRTLVSKHNIDVQLSDNDGWTALHYFSKIGSYQLVKAVADMGIGINVKTNNAKNCLHIAADYGHFKLYRMLISRDHVDVELPDEDG